MALQTSTENFIPKDEKNDNGHMIDVKEESPPKEKCKGKFLFAVFCITDDEKLAIFLRNLFINVVIFLLATAYFAWATWYYISNTDSITWEIFSSTTCDGYGFLVLLYITYVYGVLYSYVLKPYCLPVLNSQIWVPGTQLLNSIKYGSIIFYVSFLVATIAYLVFDTADNRNRLIPLSGLSLFLIVGYVFSASRPNIPWNTILWGIILQFLFGLLTIRWETGRNVLECVGAKATTFLEYAFQGAAFTYGDELVNDYKVFAFRALSSVFLMGLSVNILYYYGIMQKIVAGFGEFLEWIMGTTVCESVNCAATVFLGMSEAPLLIKPYLKDLTDSEMHSIMAAGFATVSGSTLAAYVSYGARAQDLVTASIMSAPAALCFSKLLYPETEKVKVTKDTVHMVDVEYDSVLDAASKGASDAYQIICGIIAGVIAFLSFIYFINAVLSWFGILVGFTDDDSQWSLTLISGKIFMPISYLMGVPWDECEKVGQLIGIKTMVNEFVAFQTMGSMELTDRTKVIATYAICGFSNPGSIGIQISILGALVPEKREAITSLVFRAFVVGALVCFMTACIAGTLMPDDAVGS